MGTRTSQLQIRITPAEKATLKKLAAQAGQSVSGYVLSRVLPSTELEIAELLERLADRPADHRALLAELAEALDRLSGEEVAERVSSPEPDTLPPVLLNSVAALVETAAHRKGVEPPAWVRHVPPLTRPHFGWMLRSLKPHQIRVAPVAFKRRNIFFDPRRGTYSVNKGAASPGEATLFERLDMRLAERDIEVEFYFISGAVMLQAFAANPGTAHVSAMFRPAAPVLEAVREVARDAGVPEGWVQDGVRRLLVGPAGGGGTSGAYVELPHVRVFAALPAHVLAVKCAAMRLGDDFHEMDDVRYLLRAMNITSADDALEIVTSYFAERQLASATRARVETILGA